MGRFCNSRDLVGSKTYPGIRPFFCPSRNRPRTNSCRSFGFSPRVSHRSLTSQPGSHKFSLTRHLDPVWHSRCIGKRRECRRRAACMIVGAKSVESMRPGLAYCTADIDRTGVIRPAGWRRRPCHFADYAVHQWPRIWKKKQNLESFWLNSAPGPADFVISNCQHAGWRGEMEGGKCGVRNAELTVVSGQLAVRSCDGVDGWGSAEYRGEPGEVPPTN
jgi:hypothetical protein